MVDLSKFLEGVAALLWPLVVILVIFAFRPAVAALLESAKSRKFTIKVGGQELTMEEANKQQSAFITDLQGQVAELRKRVEAALPNVRTPARLEAVPPRPPSAPLHTRRESVLWVDDNPKNNSYLVQHLRDLGANVDLALSTSEGLARFDEKPYTKVISDMGRAEGASYNEDAGIDLLKAIRGKDKDVPVIIYCSLRGVHQYREEAQADGATAITSSPTELLAVLAIEPFA